MEKIMTNISFASLLLNNLKERNAIKERIYEVIKVEEFPFDAQDEQLKEVILELFGIEDTFYEVTEHQTIKYRYIANDNIYAFMEEDITLNEILENLEEIGRRSRGIV